MGSLHSQFVINICHIRLINERNTQNFTTSCSYPRGLEVYKVFKLVVAAMFVPQNVQHFENGLTHFHMR
jgi:hypothetical protein